ncbi:unnamed protein product, partial [Amoebophrya sp. A25]
VSAIQALVVHPRSVVQQSTNVHMMAIRAGFKVHQEARSVAALKVILAALIHIVTTISQRMETDCLHLVVSNTHGSAPPLPANASDEERQRLLLDWRASGAPGTSDGTPRLPTAEGGSKSS